MADRKEPSVGGLEHVEPGNRIPTLRDIVAPEEKSSRNEASPTADRATPPQSPHEEIWSLRLPNQAGAAQPSTPSKAAKSASAEVDFEAVVDRALDRLAPILRGLIAEALAELRKPDETRE